MNNTNPHEGHRSRLKNRFIRTGLDSFEEHNVLELMLFYAIPYKDTNALAHRLIDEFGSFEAVLEAPMEKLREVPGVGENTATLIKLFHAVSRYFDECKHKLQVRLSTPDSIADYVRAHCRFRSEEVFLAFALDSDCHYLASEDISTGNAGMTEVNIRRVVDFLLRSKAACAIVAHNHPSGNLTPSVDDMTTTRKLCDALRMIDVRLLDHIIVSNDDYLSMCSQVQFSSIFENKRLR